MNRLMFFFMSLLLMNSASYAQNQINQPNPYYNSAPLIINTNQPTEISASPYTINIQTKVLYNAEPDGYLVTYTKSFISQTIQSVERKMNVETDSLIREVRSLNIQKGDILVDVTALDPIYSLNLRDAETVDPTGYKITENITFNVENMDQVRRLSKACLEYKFHDLLKIQAYIDNAQPILNDLDAKSVELLNAKKELSENVGWKFDGGTVSFNEKKLVFYPNDRYLLSLAQNRDALYQHHLSQNSVVQYNRQLKHNSQYNYNHKNADFVFNANSNEPVVQFYAELNYSYTKKDPEEEARKAAAEEEEKNKSESSKVFYMLKDDGSIQKIDLD
ncbi:MAG: hypothetical protein MK212_02845 [Saprospiraceae bacterium]|nr:hypothetical protein [Saprospiraceae bacterium]